MTRDMDTVTQNSCVGFRGVCVKAASLITNALAFLLFISCSSSKDQPFTYTLRFFLLGNLEGVVGIW